MSGLFDICVDQIKQEEFEKEALTRPMASALKTKVKPQMIITYNPQNHQSQLMVKRLDNVLTRLQGLERLEIVALNEMIDQAAIKELGIPKLGITLLVRGEKIGTLAGVSSEMEISKFILDNKGKLT